MTLPSCWSVCAALLIAQCFGQVVVQNGDFEDSEAHFDRDFPGWERVDSSEVIAPGGTTHSTPEGNLIVGWLIPASPAGGNMLEARNEGAIYPAEGAFQEIQGLEPGARYRLSFYQANAGHRDWRPELPEKACGDGAWVVTFGNEVRHSPTMTFEGFGSQSWNCIQFDFVATSESQELKFVATGSGGRMALDGVRLSRILDENMELVVGRYDQALSELPLYVSQIPEGETIELRWSHDARTFHSFEPFLMVNSETSQPISVSVDVSEIPKFFVRVYATCEPEVDDVTAARKTGPE